MPKFLVELYSPGTDAAARDAQAARVAAEGLTRQGTLVRYLHSIFLPEDETSLFLFSAASAEDVREAGHVAGLPFDRVAEAVASP